MQIFAEMRANLFKRCNGTRILLKGKSDEHYDSAIFKGTQQKAIIICQGMGRFYEEMPYTEYLIKCIRLHLGNITVAFVNNPGIIESTGVQSPDNIGFSVFKLYRHLIRKEGFDPEDILCYGHSDGGLHALFGAHRIQELYPEKRISIISDRSYIDITCVIKHFIGGLKGSLLSSLFTLCGWSTPNVLNKFLSLQGKKLVIYSSRDPIVTKQASLRYAIEGKISENVQVIKLDNSAAVLTPYPLVVHNKSLMVTEKLCTHHKRSFSTEEGEQVFGAIRNILFPISQKT